MNLISIYTFLEKRFGFWSYKSGAFIFILSRTIGAALRLFLAAIVLELFLFSGEDSLLVSLDSISILGVPINTFYLTIFITLGLIWLYTFKGGIKTIIWADTFQTVFLISSIIISVFLIANELNFSFRTLIATVNDSPYSKIFFWDYKDNKFFLKQFFAGIFICIAMTGLDQDLMQKNLTCKNISEAKKNMFSFSAIFVFVNFLFLTLGSLLYIYSNTKGIPIPERSDLLFPALAKNYFGVVAGISFLLGIIASSYASADSALASLTTSFCIDFLSFSEEGKFVEQQKQKIKTWVHVGFSVLLFVVIAIFREINNSAVITAVFTMASYTYGPLLGMYSFGLFSKRSVYDRFVPLVCILSPLLCFVLDKSSVILFNGYKFGFEILIVNALFTIIGLFLFSRKSTGLVEKY